MATVLLPIKSEYLNALERRLEQPRAGERLPPPADIPRFLDQAHEAGRAFADIAELPIDALQGVSEDDARAIQQAFGIRTVRELAEHPVIRAATAITQLAGPGSGEGGEESAGAIIREVPGVSGGYPVIGNTRIAVRLVVEAYRQTGDLAGTVEVFPQLTRDQVKAALDYYRANPSRVDEDIERNARTLRALRAR